MQSLIINLDEIQFKIGYWFKNTDLLLQAFRHNSYASQYGGESNELLGYLGKSILNFYVVKVIADRFGYVMAQCDRFDEKNDKNDFLMRERKHLSFMALNHQIISIETLAGRIDKLDLFKYIQFGDEFFGVQKSDDKLTKTKAILFKSILGAVAIDSDWNHDELQNAVEFMLIIDEYLVDKSIKTIKLSEIQLENSLNLLNELAELGKCSIPEYTFSNEKVILKDGKLKWECTCYIRSWALKHKAYGKTKDEAKRHSAFLVLCDFFGKCNEFNT